MPNVCHSTLKVYGPSHLAERARSMIARIFGPCMPDYSNPFLKSEPDNPPLAVIRIESREVPPVAIIGEMSDWEPGLVFELLYSNWASGVRGRRVYQGGDVTSESREAFQIEAEIEAVPCDDPRPAASPNPLDSQPAVRRKSGPAQTVIQHGEPPTAGATGGHSPGRREYVSHCLERYHTLLRRRLHDHCELTPGEQAEKEGCFAVVSAFKQRMDDDDRFYIEQLEEQHDLGSSRYYFQLQLHSRLAQSLREFDVPAVRDLLDAEDHETLQRMTRVLDRLCPRREAC